jgi:hypothetical protein
MSPYYLNTFYRDEGADSLMAFVARVHERKEHPSLISPKEETTKR